MPRAREISSVVSTAPGEAIEAVEFETVAGAFFGSSHGLKRLIFPIKGLDLSPLTGKLRGSAFNPLM